MVFDCESVGLHGTTFEVGYVVVGIDGTELDRGLAGCLPGRVSGNDSGRKWVKENCPTMPCQMGSAHSVREWFWNEWCQWREKGAILVADCAWPVEARFLLQCVDDMPIDREWKGPYPLHDLASILLACGQDPVRKFDRLPSELPEHNPLNDARQSARILAAALKTLRMQGQLILFTQALTA
jgi:hypothetical protein